MSASDSEISSFYTVLGHPLRRNMIRIIGDAGAASFTDLRARLKVSVGTLYYNIDLMEGLVTQDESKRYILTSKGETAYRLLIESEEKLASLGVEVERRAGWLRFLSRALTLRSLFSYMCESPKLFLPTAVTILAYGVWIIYEAQLFPMVIFYSERLMLPPVYAPLLFIGGWMLINIVGNIVPLVLYGRPKEGFECLLIGSCYALLPSLALPTVWFLCRGFLIRLILGVAQAIMLLSAGYSLCLLTTAISVAKGLKTERAALVSMMVLYLAVGLLLVFFEF